MSSIGKRKVVVIHHARVFSVKAVLFWSIIHALGAVLVLSMVVVVPIRDMIATPPRVFDMWDQSRMWFVLTLTTMVPVRWVYQRITGFGIVFYCAIFAVFLPLWNEILIFLWFDLELKIPVLHRPGLAIFSLVPTDLLAAGLLGCSLACCLCRWWYGKVFVQDGSMCPGCGYLLVGSVDRICPECGREFTYQELGTTVEELSLLEHSKNVDGVAEADDLAN